MEIRMASLLSLRSLQTRMVMGSYPSRNSRQQTVEIASLQWRETHTASTFHSPYLERPKETNSCWRQVHSTFLIRGTWIFYFILCLSCTSRMCDMLQVTMFNFIFNDRPLCSYTPLNIQRQEVIGLHTFRCCRQPCRALARILSPGYPRYIPSKKNKNAWKNDAWKTPFLLGYRHLFQEFQAVSHFK